MSLYLEPRTGYTRPVCAPSGWAGQGDWACRAAVARRAHRARNPNNTRCWAGQAALRQGPSAGIDGERLKETYAGPHGRRDPDRGDSEEAEIIARAPNYRPNKNHGTL